MEKGGTVGLGGSGGRPTNVVGNWDVTVTVRLTAENMPQNVAEQLCASAFSIGLPATGWLREIEVTSEASKETQIQTVRPGVIPLGGKGNRG